MATRKKTGGRQKGTPNKMKGAQHDLIEAWAKCAGPKTAERLVKMAIAKAFGYKVEEKTYDADGKLERRKVWHEFSVEPLKALLPYIAKKLPILIEATGKDGAPLNPEAPVPKLDLKKFTPEALRKLIEATK